MHGGGHRVGMVATIAIGHSEASQLSLGGRSEHPKERDTNTEVDEVEAATTSL